MGDQILVWVKENVKKGQLKELIKTHTGLTPPVFLAAVAAVAAATAFAVSSVSYLLSSTDKRELELEDIIEEEIMPYSESRDIDVTMTEPVFLADTEDLLEKEEELELELEQEAEDVDTINSDYMEVVVEEEEEEAEKGEE